MAIATVIQNHPDTFRWKIGVTGTNVSSDGRSADSRHTFALDKLMRGLDASGVSAQVVEMMPFLGITIDAVRVKVRFLENQNATNISWLDGNIQNFGEVRDTLNSLKSFRAELTIGTAMAGREPFVGFWYYTLDTGIASAAQVGCGFFDGVNVLMGWLSSGSVETCRIAGASSIQAGGTTTSFAGFHGGNNNNTRASQYYQNGVAIGAAGPGGIGLFPAAQSNFRITAQGNTSNGALNYWRRSMSFWAITDNLAANIPIAEAALAFYNAVRHFNSILGRV